MATVPYLLVSLEYSLLNMPQVVCFAGFATGFDYRRLSKLEIKSLQRKRKVLKALSGRLQSSCFLVSISFMSIELLWVLLYLDLRLPISSMLTQLWNCWAQNCKHDSATVWLLFIHHDNLHIFQWHLISMDFHEILCYMQMGSMLFSSYVVNFITFFLMFLPLSIYISSSILTFNRE